MSYQQHDDSSIDFLFLLNTLRRRLWTVLLGGLLVVILATVYVVLVPERYTSSAKVLFDPTGANVAGSATSTIPRMRVESEIEVARSETTMLRVIRDLSLVQQPEFLPKTNPLIDLYGAVFDVPIQETQAEKTFNHVRDRLRQAITVRQVGLSSVIDFSVETENADLSSDIANALANAYIEVQVESKINAALTTLTVIQAASEEALANLERTQIALVGYLGDNASLISQQTGNFEIGLIALDLQNGQEDLTNLTAQRERIEFLLADGDFDALGVELLNSLSGDVLTELQAQTFQQLEARRKSLLRARQEGRAPENIDLQLAQIENDLNDVASDRVRQLVELSTEQKRLLSSLSSQLESEIFNVDLPPAIAAELFSLQSSAQSARRQYTGLLDQTELLAVQARTQVAESRLFAPASPSTSASFPNASLILALALVVGLAASTALVIIFEVYFGGFTTGGQLRDYLGLAHVVEVPSFNADTSIIDLAIREPFSSPIEQMRMIRAMLELSFSAANGDENKTSGHVVAMISSMPAEGKTTAAVGLGMVCASVGLRVCIVDLDFRRPQIAVRTGLEANLDLMNFLKSGKDFPKPQRFAAPGMDNGIDVITTDFDDSAMADQLFFGQNFSLFIATLQESYDFVILDTAPVLSVAATRFVLKVADNLVYCVKANATTKRVVTDTFHSLGLANQTGPLPILALCQTKTIDIGYYNAYQPYKK